MTNLHSSQGLHSEWVVNQAAPAVVDEVHDAILVWAEDRDSGLPVYIHELDQTRRGSDCRCVCPSCRAKLTAINVGKDREDISMRPHFRHPRGMPRLSCLVDTARMAALRLFKEEGLLTLPGRNFDHPVKGLEGRVYMAKRGIPSEQVRVCHAETWDAVTALLRLDDGRLLRVRLVGHQKAINEDKDSIPTILVSINDARLASLSPDHLRERLQLLIKDGEWCSHWKDNDNKVDLETEETGLRLEWDDGTLYPDLPCTLRSETLLHIKAKEVLQRVARISLPMHYVSVQDNTLKGDLIERHRMLPMMHCTLSNVRLEHPMRATRPDVIATIENDLGWPSRELLVEVTVTNALDKERIERIRSLGHAAIEIDLSGFAGVVTAQEFERLVVDILEGKRWLLHPGADEIKETLLITVALEKQNKDANYRLWLEAVADRAQYSQKPVTHWRDQFIQALIALGTSNNDHLQDDESNRLLEDAAKGMAIHGYHQGLAFCLDVRELRPLWKILSIRLGRPIGFNVGTAWQVINTFFSERGWRSLLWHTLYLLAIRTYQPALTEHQLALIQKHRLKVRDSLKAGESLYRRDTKLNPFIGLLFPEMNEGLSRPLPSGRN